MAYDERARFDKGRSRCSLLPLGELISAEAPYIVVLALVIGGVAFTNISAQPLTGYWEFMALVTGGLCVITEWKNVEHRQARLRLMWT